MTIVIAASTTNYNCIGTTAE